MAPFLNGSLTRRAHAITVQILLLLLPPSSHRRYNLTRCIIPSSLLYLSAMLTATLDVHARDIAE